MLRFIGSIDEDAALDKVKISNRKNVVMDVGKIESINSCGGREWVKWIRAIDAKVEFVNCSSVFLDYANMIDGFVPKNGVIESFNVPYYCESCDHLSLRMFQSRDIRSQKGQIPETTQCDQCKKEAEIDVMVPTFLKFLNTPTP